MNLDNSVRDIPTKDYFLTLLALPKYMTDNPKAYEQARDVDEPGAVVVAQQGDE
jgi:hypothetical protein